jgi:cobaltochelatase CobT
MGQAQAAARHQQKVEELCAATIRALSGEPDLHFRSRRLHLGQRRLPFSAAHLQPSFETDDFRSFRGAADGLALRVVQSDASLHRRLCPQNPIERLLFELLEQIRVESLVPPGMPGVTHNLRHRYQQWALAFFRSGLTESARGILLYTVTQICRARVTGESVLEETEDLIEATRGALVPTLGHDLAGLRRHRKDQAAYAAHAISIARLIGEAVQSAEGEQRRKRSNLETEDAASAAFDLMMDFDAGSEDGIPAAGTGLGLPLDVNTGRYKVFTTAYDREVTAGSVVRREQLREYREQLDQRISAQRLNIPRLTRELKALLAQPGLDGWDSGQEEGRIDGRRLAQLVTSPAERRLFRSEREEPVANCVVSFLIDCSGSMKQHIEAVALLVDVFARALDQAGAASEVLGYSTQAWNGGRARRDWQRMGRPKQPGRLNEVSHMVFKSAETTWRRARSDIAALLKTDLFREGIDGEAVGWACRRLDGRCEKRRMLFVISDGCPMDSATNIANDSNYLDNHLREVVVGQERTGRIAIFGIGVGLDLSPYYARGQALDLSTPPGYAVFGEILKMIGRHLRHEPHSNKGD